MEIDFEREIFSLQVSRAARTAAAARTATAATQRAATARTTEGGGRRRRKVQETGSLWRNKDPGEAETGRGRDRGLSQMIEEGREGGEVMMKTDPGGERSKKGGDGTTLIAPMTTGNLGRKTEGTEIETRCTSRERRMRTETDGGRGRDLGPERGRGRGRGRDRGEIGTDLSPLRSDGDAEVTVEWNIVLLLL